MKITIVLGAFFPVPPTKGGGVEKVWFTLAPEFAKRGHQVVMISRKLPQLPREEMIDGVKHIRVDGFDTPRWLAWLKFLDLVYSRRVMSTLPPADIVVTNTFWLPILLRDRTRGKLYVHVGRYPKGQMRFYRRAARLQAPSRAIANEIETQTPQLADKVRAIAYPVTESRIAEPKSINNRPKIVLYVGRVHPEKGVHALVSAFASGARAAFADWKLMIIGPTETNLGGGGESYLDSLRRAASQAKDKIIISGPIFDSVELSRAYQQAQLFVYPSLSERGESFGLAPLEAMAHSCAALVSNLDCFQDFIRDNETGFIFDHRAQPIAETLRAKIENILTDERALARVAVAGYEKSAEYSPQHMAEQFLNDFESVIREDV